MFAEVRRLHQQLMSLGKCSMTQSNMAKWDVSSFKPWDESGSCDMPPDAFYCSVYSNHTSNDDNIPMSGCGASSGAQTKGFYQGTKNY
mmetsp:Transcript_94937/g.153116  ORF Transcript_94937/g.153116 Transcript_94937/m.153116 type:complete len:88 (-) Transcript_94937:46-309(-)